MEDNNFVGSTIGAKKYLFLTSMYASTEYNAIILCFWLYINSKYSFDRKIIFVEKTIPRNKKNCIKNYIVRKS